MDNVTIKQTLALLDGFTRRPGTAEGYCWMSAGHPYREDDLPEYLDVYEDLRRLERRHVNEDHVVDWIGYVVDLSEPNGPGWSGRIRGAQLCLEAPLRIRALALLTVIGVRDSGTGELNEAALAAYIKKEYDENH